MAEQRSLSQLEEFDPAWLDSLDWTNPKTAQKQIQDKIAAWRQSADEKLKNYNAGMTKAQQSAAELRDRAAKADEWEKWRRDNQWWLPKWQEAAQAAGTTDVDALLQRVRGQQTAVSNAEQARREVQEGATMISDAYQRGEIEWEDAQKFIGRLAAKERELNDAIEWHQHQRTVDYKRFEDALMQQRKEAYETSFQLLNAMLEPIVDGIDAIAPDNRKLRPVLEKMGKDQIRSYGDAWNAMYGEDEMRTKIRAELEAEKEKDLAAAKEELRREQEKHTPMFAPEGSGSGGEGPMLTWHRPSAREDAKGEGGKRPDFYQRIAERVINARR